VAATDTGTRLERAAGLCTLRLDRPPMNALDEDLLQLLTEVVAGLEVDASCRALLVVSEAQVFAAGADIKMLERADAALQQRFRDGVQALFDRIERLPFPTVAAIEGHAMGGGLELALACDVRVLSDAPDLKLGLPEVRLGLLPGAGGTQRLSRLLGKTRALDLLLSGRSLDAATALEWGVVTEVAPAPTTRARAAELAERFAAGPTVAYAALKRCALAALHGDLAEGLALERAEAEALMATDDAAEGMAAFVAHRRPSFTGR
jgi:enoyl-CoA hydratase/carnithine racemase